MSDNINIKEGLFKVFKTSDSPLKFFMILVVVFGGLAYALITNSSLPSELTVTLTLVILGLILLIGIGITILLIFHPKKLTFDKEAHITVMREHLGDSELPLKYYESAKEEPSEAPLSLKSKITKEGEK